MTVSEMQQVDIRKVNREDLVDIRDVEVDRSLPREERIRDFVEKIKNPYCFKCGDVIVKTSFADSGATLEGQMESYLRTR